MPASSAPGTTRSAPSASPLARHTAKKPPVSPAPSASAPTNVTTASAMPAAQVRTSPQRATARTHSGSDTAPATKYAARNAPSSAGACSRSRTKNSTSVAGTALAMPLSRNTAINPRNPATRHGAAIDSGAATRLRSTGRGAHVSASSAIPSASANTPTIAGSPAADGNTLASTTPTSAAPSRQPIQRACAASPPPRRAPQVWCSTLATL